MNELVLMIICCTAFAAFSQRRGESRFGHEYAKRERMFFCFITVYMIVFSGLRVAYNDTQSYIKGFADSPEFPEVLSQMEWDFGSNPGFVIFTAISKTISNSSNLFLMFCAAITLYIDIWFIQKYSKSFAVSIFLFFMLGYYTFTMAAVKQTLSTAFALVAMDRLIRKKKISFVFFLLLGMTMHPYCAVFFLAPILMKQIPWRKGTWFLIVFVLIVSYSFNFLLGAILDITAIMGEGYDAETFIGEGVNVFRVLVYFVPVVISFLWRRTLFERCSKIDNLFVNCTIVCALIMFIGMFGNANMFARLARYFEPALHISLPWMLYKLRGEMVGFVLSACSYVAFPLYFYYQMAIAMVFDYAYASISIGDFINALFS